MGRLIDADAFSAFIKNAICKHKYDRMEVGPLLTNMLTVADVLNSVCAELDGTGLEGFKNAPTVDAIPVRHGEWMLCSPLYEDGPSGYVCSECKIGGWEKTNYCPHCGAKMDGRDEYDD